MSGEWERIFKLAGEISERLGEGLQGMVPEEAKQHLLAAQKELFSALMLIYEHQMRSRRERPEESFTPSPTPPRPTPSEQARRGPRAGEGPDNNRSHRIKID